MKKLYILILIIGLAKISHAQVRCVSQELYEKTHGINAPQVTDQFENWIKKKIEDPSKNSLRIEAEILQIPIVVHVLHNGEPIGEGLNISKEQILSQITVLNEDFRRLNPDKGSTPLEFQPVAADIEIEFVLAKQDPEGIDTDGIVRVKSRDTWDWSEQVIMKAESYWPAEDYLNIWISDLTHAGQNALGGSSFPEANLPGLPALGTENPLTDGVIIDYLAFGSEILYPQGKYNSSFNRGRTATHEIGHFLGLRHIWGDANTCGASDFCDDTPEQISFTKGCKTTNTSCNSRDMVQNFMDYTDDACMNLFTSDQKARIRAVLESSPRRKSLTISKGLFEPEILENNLGISEIISPLNNSCDPLLSPVIKLRNYGFNNVIQASIDLYHNDVLFETTALNLNLGYLETIEITLGELSLQRGNLSSLRTTITSVNNAPNTNSNNFTKEWNIYVPNVSDLPIMEEFNSNQELWSIYNPDNSITWTTQNAPADSPDNNALMINSFNYEAYGEIDGFLSPLVNLPNDKPTFLSFDYAYAPYSSNADRDDILLVGIYENCSINFDTIDTLFFAAGPALATADARNRSFIPSNSSEWASERFISLEKYKGKSDIQLGFFSINNYGNNIFIDNIYLSTSEKEDIGISSVESPSLFSCVSSPEPSIFVSNNGSTIVKSFELAYSLNGANERKERYENIEILPGDTFRARLPQLAANEGDNELAINLLFPNGNIDADIIDNSLIYSFTVSSREVLMPNRWNFETDLEDWSSISSDDALNWTTDTFNDGAIARYPGSNSTNSGEQTWYFSPLFSLEEFDKSSLFFDLSYANNNLGSEELIVFLSEDCGASYTKFIYQKSGKNLATVLQPVDNFTPTLNTDWRREYVNLNDFAGKEDLRLAFLINHGAGNNLYLDNIEIFDGDNPFPLKIDNVFSKVYPNPTYSGNFNITFKFESHEDLNVIVFNMRGQIIKEFKHDNVLNQTFEYNIDELPDNIFIIKIVGETFTSTQKLMFGR